MKEMKPTAKAAKTVASTSVAAIDAADGDDGAGLDQLRRTSNTPTVERGAAGDDRAPRLYLAVRCGQRIPFDEFVGSEATARSAFVTGENDVHALAQLLDGMIAQVPANQFGTGKVDFAGLFKALNNAGFKGPVMVEGTAVGATLEETVANARASSTR